MLSYLPFKLNPVWTPVIQIIYMLLIAFVCIRVILDTRSVSKTLAYLLLIIFFPVFGVIFYFSFGVNYRIRKIYNKKLQSNTLKKQQFLAYHKLLKAHILENPPQELQDFKQTHTLLSNAALGGDLCMPNTRLKVLQNGEDKFECLLAELDKAQHHIHIEYYIFEDDIIGNAIADTLIAKVKEGVEVRFIYDDFGSSSIRNGFVKKLRKAGIEAYAFNKIKLIFLANRLNYRNHRKIVVIDGLVSFVGGINVADKYINNNNKHNNVYWRDTHLMIEGYSTLALQQVFLNDWNFCSGQQLEIDDAFFPVNTIKQPLSNFVQIVASGPDNDRPNILYSVINAINAAKEEILICTPYYIPDAILQESLILAALSGKDVRLLVPLRGDSALVTIASNSFFEELLQAGVKIYQYKKGFIHAKTFIIDRTLGCVGTANMDTRSFDLNFEVNAMIYDAATAAELANTFYKDLQDARILEIKRWKIRPKLRVGIEKLIRLISPFM